MVLNYELMARSAEARKKKEEEEANKGKVDWGGVLLGAAAAWATAGLAPMLLGGAAALAPTATTILPAIAGGIKGASAKSMGEAALSGVETGAAPTATKWAADTANAAGEAARLAWEAKPENKKYLPKTATYGEKGPAYAYENPAVATAKEIEKDKLDQAKVASMKKAGTFSYTERPGSTRFNTTLPEANPSMPAEAGNPRFYTPTKVAAKGSSTSFRPTDELFSIANEYNDTNGRR
jgi:hypothetical protein